MGGNSARGDEIFSIKRTKRMFESNNISFLWNSASSVAVGHSVRCTSEEFISVIYCRPPADNQADRDIKGRPYKTGFNLWSLFPRLLSATSLLRQFSMSKNRLSRSSGTVLTGMTAGWYSISRDRWNFFHFKSLLPRPGIIRVESALHARNCIRDVFYCQLFAFGQLGRFEDTVQEVSWQSFNFKPSADYIVPKDYGCKDGLQRCTTVAKM